MHVRLTFVRLLRLPGKRSVCQLKQIAENFNEKRHQGVAALSENDAESGRHTRLRWTQAQLLGALAATGRRCYIRSGYSGTQECKEEGDLHACGRGRDLEDRDFNWFHHTTQTLKHEIVQRPSNGIGCKHAIRFYTSYLPLARASVKKSLRMNP